VLTSCPSFFSIFNRPENSALFQGLDLLLPQTFVISNRTTERPERQHLKTQKRLSHFQSSGRDRITGISGGNACYLFRRFHNIVHSL